MASDSTTWNAYEATGEGVLAPGVNATVTVDSVFGLELGDLIYLVADPDDSDLREWMQAEVNSGNVLKMVKRNLAGSVGDLSHGGEAKYRAVFTKQLQDDIFSDLIATELWANQHVNSVPDPHSQYLLESEAYGEFLPTTGGRMTGALFLQDSPPTDGDHATRKVYVDDGDASVAGDSADALDEHAALPSVHHARYTDAEAIAAVGDPSGGIYLPLHGTADAAQKWNTQRSFKMQLSGDASGQVTELVDGSGSITWVIPVAVANDSHTHDTRYYTESESDARYEPKGTGGGTDYLPITGGTLTGALVLPISDGVTTTLRWGGMGTNDGAYGNSVEMSFGFDGWRSLSMFHPASGGQEHVVQARSNVRTTRPFKMYNAAATSSSDICFSGQWGTNVVDVSYGNLTALNALAAKVNELLALV